MSNDTNLNFIHRFIPSSNNPEKEYPTLLLLHGTGGSEDDLIQIGKMISPHSSLLSPRGKVLEHGMPRFFRRLAEGVFDIKDLKFRTQELAKFVHDASSKYSFDLNKTVAIGFSNGANIAASLLLLNPETINGAILFRAMKPFNPDNLPDLSNKQVLLSAGLIDPIVSKSQIEGLFNLLQKSGADVTMKWQQSGHNINNKDISDAKEWLSKKVH
ncbi:MAG TPA: alpha/beta hydrolase [Candidatus Sulfopaludibacter sp.]|jgi:phospholipase/carboxylesterase|nr:alpha/beta hydrolase [Candidatus Sulfopaludibacter sp.]